MDIDIEYINKYNDFLDYLKTMFKGEHTINIIEKYYNLSNENKLQNGLLFSNNIDEHNIDDFFNNRIKIFSHKKSKIMSTSLFGNDLCIKNIINTQSIETRNVIWKFLHHLWLVLEYRKDKELRNEEFILKIEKKYKNTIDKSEVTSKIKEAIGSELTGETLNLIDDVIMLFDEFINNLNNKPDSNDPNILSDIIGISQKICKKYANKISNGNINLEQILKVILSKVSEIAPGLSGLNLDNLFNNLSSSSNEPPIIITDNFSTADVKVGELKDNSSASTINIGSLLKLADNIGIIPGSNNNCNINKIFDIFNKLNKNITDETNLTHIKEEMESFLQNDLGVDINEITKHLEENICEDNNT